VSPDRPIHGFPDLEAVCGRSRVDLGDDLGRRARRLLAATTGQTDVDD
jgi:hypothetical protein